MNALDMFSDEQLLLELVRRHGFQQAPSRVEYCGDRWLVCTVGIGKDASTSLFMDKDDLKELAVLALVERKGEEK